MNYQSFTIPVLTPSKAALIRNGITREEYRRRFGMCEAAVAYFSQVDKDRALAESIKQIKTDEALIVDAGIRPGSIKARIIGFIKPGVSVSAKMVAICLGKSQNKISDELRDLTRNGLLVATKVQGSPITYRRPDK